jgi:hypothetical protein
MTATTRVKNVWGVFEVDVESGLPVLPEGQYWKVVPDTVIKTYCHLYLMTNETSFVKRLFRKPRLKIRAKVLEDIIMDQDDLSPEFLLSRACQLLVTTSDEWKEEQRLAEALREEVAKSQALSEYKAKIFNKPIFTAPSTGARAIETGDIRGAIER